MLDFLNSRRSSLLVWATERNWHTTLPRDPKWYGDVQSCRYEHSGRKFVNQAKGPYCYSTFDLWRPRSNTISRGLRYIKLSIWAYDQIFQSRRSRAGIHDPWQPELWKFGNSNEITSKKYYRISYKLYSTIFLQLNLSPPIIYMVFVQCVLWRLPFAIETSSSAYFLQDCRIKYRWWVHHERLFMGLKVFVER